MEVPQADMATVFRSAGSLGEMEAQTVLGVLESNGVPAFITGIESMPGPYRLPASEICVQVEPARREEAERLLSEARAAGPAAAEEAEAASEIR